MGPVYSQKEPVLISLCGHSPAVVTETVWALARETPPIVPSRAVVVTTRSGADRLRQEVLRSGVWDRLRSCIAPGKQNLLRFGDTGDAVRIIPDFERHSELEDIRTASDSEAAADFILEVLRQFTGNPSCRVILSVAGGRKTMSVLAAMGLTLLGRPDDRMCHVLVPPPFDDPRLTPRFYFPDPDVPEYRIADGDREIRIEPPDPDVVTLAEIPYVRSRYLFHERYGEVPGSFRATVALALDEARRLAPTVTLTIDSTLGECRINDITVSLSALEFSLLWYFAERTRQDMGPVRGLKDLWSGLMEFVNSCESGEGSGAKLIREARNRLRYSADPNAVRKPLYNLNARLLKLGLSRAAVQRLCLVRPEERGVYGMHLRPEEIVVR